MDESQLFTPTSKGRNLSLPGGGYMSVERTKNGPSLLVRLSEPMVLIFLILMMTYVASFIIPAGEFVRETIDGKTIVKPGSFSYLDTVPPIHFFDVFVAIPKGLLKASQYLFIVFIAGGLFHVLEKTEALLKPALGCLSEKIGVEHKNIVITIGTFIYGFFGVAVGFENNIALVPVATLISKRHRLFGTRWDNHGRWRDRCWFCALTDQSLHRWRRPRHRSTADIFGRRVENRIGAFRTDASFQFISAKRSLKWSMRPRRFFEHDAKSR